MKNFGDLIEEQRISLGMSVQDFCEKSKMSETVLQKIEGNQILPCKIELVGLLDALKILEGSVEYFEALVAYEQSNLDSVPLRNSGNLDIYFPKMQIEKQASIEKI